MTRNPALDGLRGLAALAVIFFHTGLPGFRGGYLGVDIFFVLSGFLITSLLASEIKRSGGVDMWQFFLSRSWRLYPALIVFLAFYIIVAPLRWGESSALRDAALAGLYLSDYSAAYWHVPMRLQHTWSLSVEWHYYLIWPSVALFILRLKSARMQIAVLFALYAIALSWHYARVSTGHFQAAYFAFDTRLSGLLLGGLAAVALEKYRSVGRLRPLAPWLLIALAALIVFSPSLREETIWPQTLVELCTAGMIIAVTGQKGFVVGLLSSRALVYTGLVSYAMYLWHPLLGDGLSYGTPWYVRVPVVLPLTYLLATASWFAIERPAALVRHRLRKSAVAANLA